MQIPTCQVTHEFEVPAPQGVHGQFRNARLSTRGTLLIAHMGQDYVAEYSVQGTELTRWATDYFSVILMPHIPAVLIVANDYI